MSSTLQLDEIRGLANDPHAAATRITELLDAIDVATDDEIQSWLCECFENVDVAEVEISAVARYCLQDHAASALWACKLIGRNADHAAKYQDALTKALNGHSDLGVRQQAAYSLRSAAPFKDETKSALAKAAQESDPRLKRLAAKALEAAA